MERSRFVNMALPLCSLLTQSIVRNSQVQRALLGVVYATVAAPLAGVATEVAARKCLVYCFTNFKSIRLGGCIVGKMSLSFNVWRVSQTANDMRCLLQCLNDCIDRTPSQFGTLDYERFISLVIDYSTDLFLCHSFRIEWWFYQCKCEPAFPRKCWRAIAVWQIATKA